MLNNNNKRQKVVDYHSNYKKFSNAQSSILYFSRTEIQDKVTSSRRGKKKQKQERTLRLQPNLQCFLSYAVW